jgi:hypothetical protein
VAGNACSSLVPFSSTLVWWNRHFISFHFISFHSFIKKYLFIYLFIIILFQFLLLCSHMVWLSTKEDIAKFGCRSERRVLFLKNKKIK